MTPRPLLPILLRPLLGSLACGLCLAACTLTLEDKNAPSLQADLEIDYDLARSGGGARGRAPSPPDIKASGEVPRGAAFRIRGRMTNTFTWIDAEGSFDGDFPVEAKGWRYHGQLLAMPGISFWGDRIFLAGVTGIEGRVYELGLSDKDEPGDRSYSTLGTFGFPLGFHLECTLWRLLTPTYTFTHTFMMSYWGLAEAGNAQTSQLGLRIWPGTLVPALGGHFWIEGGYRWTRAEGLMAPILHYKFAIDGPYGGFGIRF